MAETPRKTAKEQYQQQKEEARRVRADVVSTIQERVIRTLEQVERIEVQMCRVAAAIVSDQRRRPRAQRSLQLTWRRERTRRRGSLALLNPCWRTLHGAAVEVEAQEPPPARRICRIIQPEHHEEARECREEFRELAKRRRVYLQSLDQTYGDIDVEDIEQAQDVSRYFAESIPRALPEHLSDLLHERRRRAVQIVLALMRRQEAITDMEAAIEELMIAFNAEGKRNRNLSLYWRIGNWRPHGIVLVGPECRQIYKARTGYRYRNRIADITARKIDWQRVRGPKQEADRRSTPDPDGGADDTRGGRPQTTIPMWVFTRTGQRRRAAKLRRIYGEARELAIARSRAIKSLKTADKRLPTAEEA